LKKKILLIAYNFPPLISPQSLRWFYLSRELLRKGYEVDVLTIRMPERFQDMLNDVPAAAGVYRTFPGPFYDLTFRYSREALHENPDMPSTHSKLWAFISDIHLLTWKTLNALLIPDIHIEWLPFALLKGAELIKRHSYNVIISSSEPRVCHLVGYFLKKKSGIPWVADYGDPWFYSSPAGSELYFKKTILQKIERIILKKVDAITVAAEGMKTLYQDQYPFLKRESIHIITQGFDPEMFSYIKEEPSHTFRIVYCGSFYKDLRDPKVFFDAVNEIDRQDVEVVIAGRINEFAAMAVKKGRHGKIKFLGFVGHKEALALQKNASVLLHVGNANNVQVPGKIYEYIGAGKPILCIRGGVSDLSADLIIRYNKGIVVPADKNAIKEAIAEMHALWQKGVLDRTFALSPVEEFTWGKKADDIGHIIERL
jgi:glycosyltransferase involved in cell wall biosynthesis